MHNIIIKKADIRDRDLRSLVGDLDDYLRSIYPPEGIFGLNFDDPSVNDVLFAIAYIDGVPAGCGAVRPGDGYFELKRFYVSDTYRRNGIASKILRFLEVSAAEQGCTLLRLETGPAQPEAIAFYKSRGFREVPLYGGYTDPRYSTCFEKRI